MCPVGGDAGGWIRYPYPGSGKELPACLPPGPESAKVASAHLPIVNTTGCFHKRSCESPHGESDPEQFFST